MQATNTVTEALNTLEIFPHVAEFAHRFKRELGYEQTMKTWLAYDGVCWREDTGGVGFHRCFKRYVIDALKDSAEISDPRMRAERQREINRLETRHSWLFESYAKREMPVKRSDFDTQPHLLNVLNGTLDFKAKVLREHRPEDKLMNCAPIEYREDAECPRFQHFLREITGEIRLPWQDRD